MNKEYNESMKLKNNALFRKVLKKNEIISDEKELHDCEKRCIIDGAIMVTSIGVICLGAISKFSDETMSLMAPPLAFGVVGGALRLLRNAYEATDIEMDLPEKREELYHIENDLNNADKHVKKLTK